MMILEIDTPTFPLITYVHYSWKEFKSQGIREPIGLATAKEIQANFLLITKRFYIQEMLGSIVVSSFDVRVIR